VDCLTFATELCNTAEHYGLFRWSPCGLPFATTLDRWATTIADAIQAAQKLPGVDNSKTLVIGISEGGIAGMRVSNISPQVTHAASLSGGGPVYLFQMAEYMRSKGLDPEKEVYACWSGILKDPDSASKFYWGQTYRQWSSFMKTSVIAEALKSHALLYFAYGTADAQQAVARFCRARPLTARARHTVPRCLFLRHELGGSDETAAFLQDEERSLLCIATDQVEDHIDLLSQKLLELRLSIIDNPAGSDGVEVRLIAAACRAMTVAPACDAN
jgi:pimeloyl-ACP methyl ester carboxylesterase